MSTAASKRSAIRRTTRPGRNLCIFGAVAVGPTVGGVMAGAHAWRPLFWAVAGVGVLALVFSLLTYQDAPAQDRSAPWDIVAVALAGCGCAAAFFGAAQLQGNGPAPVSLAPLLAGVAMIVALVVHQYRSRRPLMPVRQLATTFPVSGILVALCASAAAFALMELVLTALQGKTSPTRIGVLFLPEFGAALLTAVLFGVLFRTRFTPLLAVGGLVMVAAAALPRRSGRPSARTGRAGAWTSGVATSGLDAEGAPPSVREKKLLRGVAVTP